MKSIAHFLAVSQISLFLPLAALPASPAPVRESLLRVVDLNVGEMQNVLLADGVTVSVKLLSLVENRDSINHSVRDVCVQVEVNGERATLHAGNYNLPTVLRTARIDCSVTAGYCTDANRDTWSLRKDARLRMWPVRGPLIEPETFGYPLKACWFASGTQMANEPVFVNGESPPGQKIYYHNDLDLGGCEGLVDVVAATDGLVVSSANVTLPEYQASPAHARSDVVYVLDDRGWFYRYSHLATIDDAIRPGVTLRRGQRIGVLGKEGASGGWAHLHFGIVSRQPSGEWGTQEAYAFVWEAYLREYRPRILAVARPHLVGWVNERIQLDGSKSWSAAGEISRFEWTLSDGTTAAGPTVERRYPQPGTYSEVLRVTGPDGAVGWDFAVVQVFDPSRPGSAPLGIQAAYAPSLGVKAGDAVTFKVRSFGSIHGREICNFGDGSAPITVQSDGNQKPLAKDGFAVTEHRFARPGNYLVRVEREDERGEKGVAHLAVAVEP